MISEAIGAGGKRIISAMVRGLARSRISPNMLTFMGLLMNIGCGVLFGYGMFVKAGLLMILANIFDMFDGQVARLRGRVTRFGAFFDSVIDRYSDVIVFVGIVLGRRRRALHDVVADTAVIYDYDAQAARLRRLLVRRTAPANAGDASAAPGDAFTTAG